MGEHHDVVVIGSGNAGISLAARLRRLGCTDVLIVSPAETHYYRPLLNYVAGGQASLRELTWPTRDVIPRGCQWRQDRAVLVDPAAREVHLQQGGRIGFNDVVLAPGLEPDLDATPGLAAALDDGWAATAHLSASADRAREAVERLAGAGSGRVVFTIPPEPAPCGGTALKPLLMACDRWERTAALGRLDVHLVTPFASVLDVPWVDDLLLGRLGRYGVTVHSRRVVGAVDHRSRRVVLDGADGGRDILEDVDQAFVVPRYRAPEWTANLAGAQTGGLVDVDPLTLAHRRFPSVWALGDAAALQTRPSGGALRRQVEILAENMRRSRLGKPLRDYDGYTIIPIAVDRHHVLLAEFDRDLRPAPTVSRPDLATPRRALWAFDRYLEPVVYRYALLRGRV
jgi:sulfide:quinone oxidoreductase